MAIRRSRAGASSGASTTGPNAGWREGVRASSSSSFCRDVMMTRALSRTHRDLVVGHVVAVAVDDLPAVTLASVHVSHAQRVPYDIAAGSRRHVALDADGVRQVAARIGSHELEVVVLA